MRSTLGCAVHPLRIVALLISSTAIAAAGSPFETIDPAALPLEQEISADVGADSYGTLKYRSPTFAGDSLSQLVSGGLNYSFTQESGPSSLHFSATTGANGSHEMAGASAAGLRLSFLHGDGSGSGSRGHRFAGVNPNFFHGSAARPYRYTGAALAWSWSDDLVYHAGAVDIEAPQVDRRSVHFAGLSLGGATLRLYQLDNKYTAGQGLGLGWRGRSLSIGFQAIRSGNRAGWRELSAAWRDDRGGALRMSLSLGGNDLYADADGWRVGLSYGLSFGAGRRTSGSRRAFSLGEDPSAVEEAAGFDGMAQAALSAVGFGLLVSSGNATLDQSPRFATQPQAAYAVLSVVNPVSVARNREHGGAIYRNPDGTYSPSETVVEGTPTSVNFNPHALVPPGTLATADWHTHGAYDPRYVNEFFSPQDIAFSHYHGIDGYLGTPQGRMFEYVLAEQRVYQYLAPDGNEFILPH